MWMLGVFGNQGRFGLGGEVAVTERYLSHAVGSSGSRLENLGMVVCVEVQVLACSLRFYM